METVTDSPKTEREEVAEILAQQEPHIREIVKQVVGIERSRLHLSNQPRATVDMLFNAIREAVK